MPVLLVQTSVKVPWQCLRLSDLHDCKARQQFVEVNTILLSNQQEGRRKMSKINQQNGSKDSLLVVVASMEHHENHLDS
jgi:hypothetical protein